MDSSESVRGQPGVGNVPGLCFRFLFLHESEHFHHMLSRFYFHFRLGKCNDKSQMIQFLVFLSNRDPRTAKSNSVIRSDWFGIFKMVLFRSRPRFSFFILLRTDFGPWIPNCCTNRSDKGFKLNSAHLSVQNFIFRVKFPKIKFFGFV